MATHASEQTKVQNKSRARLYFLLAMLAIASACATSAPDRSSIIKTLRYTGDYGPFNKVLVVSAAGERSSRAQLEQELALAISGDETQATAYHSVVGRYPPISRNFLENSIRAREFDAILLVREQGQDQPDLVPNRPTGRNFDFYHYDYLELNELTAIDASSTVAFVAEVYDTNAEKKVWAIESLLFESESVTSAVSAQAGAIAAVIRRDRLVKP